MGMKPKFSVKRRWYVYQDKSGKRLIDERELRDSAEAYGISFRDAIKHLPEIDCQLCMEGRR